MSIPFAPEDVCVSFCATAALDEPVVVASFGLLSPEEQARCERFVFARDRRDFAIAHALLRRTLSRYYPIAPRDWVFVSEPGGKPRVSDDFAASAQLQFNLAHTNGLVACAVSCSAEVGVDVEAIDRRTDPIEIARRYFSAAEADDLERCAPADRLERFFEIWTLKEAYIKTIGTGLSLPLDEFAFRFDGHSALRLDVAPQHAASCSFALFAPSQRHRMAVAARIVSTAAPPRIVACPDDPVHPDSDAGAIRCTRSGVFAVG